MPLDTSVKHYTNAMNGIPTLTSSANSLIRLLDAVLVNGFGDVTLTSLNVSNNIATATVSTGYVTVPYCVVTISGATPAELNGDKKVLSDFQTNSFTFDATGVPNGAATGTITCRFPGAGWTKPYANTTANVAVYRNSSGFYYRIADNLSGNNPARVIGYESMTDENTGTNPFPTTAQFSGGLYIPKSTDTNARWFWVAADSKTCYFAVAGSSTYFRNVVPITCIGDFKSLGTNDTFNQIVASSTVTTSAQEDSRYSFLSNNTNRKFVSRSYSQTIGSKEVTNYFFYNNVLTFNVPGATNGFSYPNLPDNNLMLFDKIFITESNSLRGYYRGITPTVNAIGPNQRNFENDRIFENLPSAGKISLLKWIGHYDYNAAQDGAFFLDVAGPWE